MTDPELKLFTFFNSSAAFRVRIALGLKGCHWSQIPVNLRAKQHRTDKYQLLNPNKLVPVLQHGQMTLSQSLAIIDYLDETFPKPLLVPKEQPLRSKVLELALTIACDLHPLNNLRVLRYLIGSLKCSDQEKNIWIHHWMEEGFTAVENFLPNGEAWAFGENPTLADCCIVPQVANAERSDFDLARFPKVQRVNDFCIKHPAFVTAAPAAQSDYVGA